MTKEDLKSFVLNILKENAPAIDVENAVKDQFDKMLEESKKGDQARFDEMRKQVETEAKPVEKIDGGTMVARMSRALGMTKGDVDRAIAFAGKEWKDESVVKALREGAPTAGGFLVPEEYSTDVIELLRAEAVVRQLGPQVLPMSTGTLRIPKITAGASAYYVGESQNITKSEPTTGQITLRWKKLAALVPVSNDLLRYSSPGADALVRADMVRALASRGDQAFIRDIGDDASPRGMRYWANADNVFASAGTSLANITSDLGKMVQRLKQNNVPITRGGWLMHPRSEIYLLTLLTSNGQYAFRDEMLRGTLWGWPYRTTTNVPVNLTDGGNTDESEIYFADFADMVIGESQRLIIDVSTEAAYVEGGSTYSSFNRDESVIRAIQEHDFAVRRDVAVAVLNVVRWNA
jgi:HK97 family phage major capsid protein